MSPTSSLLLASALLPVVLMLAAIPHRRAAVVPPVWRRFRGLSVAALSSTVASLGLQLAELGASGTALPGLSATLTGAWVAVLVQLLGTVIGAFSSR
ncbi:MAG: NADH-quinone oxidoreductase subunit L, partial [Burkholderiales bacterium 12-64-5]